MARAVGERATGTEVHRERRRVAGNVQESGLGGRLSIRPQTTRASRTGIVAAALDTPGLSRPLRRTLRRVSRPPGESPLG
jgi:hypothetical protein